MKVSLVDAMIELRPNVLELAALALTCRFAQVAIENPERVLRDILGWPFVAAAVYWLYKKGQRRRSVNAPKGRFTLAWWGFLHGIRRLLSFGL